MRIMRKTRLIYTLSALTVLNLLQTIICMNGFAGFSHLEILDGESCPANHILQEKNLDKEKKCLILCSHQLSCHGVFLGLDSASCVTCSAKFFTKDDFQSGLTSTKFYKRLGSINNGNTSGISVFHVVAQKLKWSNSEQYCNNLGGHLASTKSKEENEYVVNTTLVGIGENIWSGGKGQGGLAETFKYPDGSYVADGYVYWKNGKPDGNPQKTRCISMYQNNNFRWGDADCTVARYGLCKFEFI